MNQWKINRDPFYKPLFDKYGFDFIENAGFFFDTNPKNEDIKKTNNIICTHIPSSIYTTENPVILVTTGSFCPIHNGHIEMMEKAKQHLEKLGKNVIAGYISPSHDEYVLDKAPGWYNIHERINKISQTIENYDWLFVDPWEGIFCKVAVNFTDVIIRLQSYIYHHTKKNVEIWYVCGSDNARFANTFINQGKCIIINRPNCVYDKIENGNIIYVDGDNKLSSTYIRKNNPIFKPNFISVSLRMEECHPLENEFKHLLEDYFNNIKVNKVSKQIENFLFLKENIKSTIVSIDSLINGDINLEISRLFTLFGTKKIKHICKNPEVLNNIGNTVLFDDDISTGNTMKFAESIINEYGGKVENKISLLQYEHTEIMDCRDFLITHPKSGLVVLLPNNVIARVPYLYPFVCPRVRSSILDPVNFSKKVWELKLKYFTQHTYKVKNLPSLIPILTLSGFNMDDDMITVCEYFIELCS